jgi:apolipoprotein D and lipocalin family protein
MRNFGGRISCIIATFWYGNPMQRILFHLLVFLVIAWNSELSAQAPVKEDQMSLPYPKNFDAAKYLGKWYEIARLPAPEQPRETLATAEYLAGEKEGDVVVQNTAYAADGKLIRAITGKAQIQPGDPPRFKVTFGPAFPSEPNYFVIHVSKEYDLALVGNPNRKSLWVLSRNPNLPEKRLQRMITKANKAGFNTDNLIVSDWSKADVPKDDKTITRQQLVGTWNYVRGEKNGEMLDENHFQGQSIEITEKDMTLKSDQLQFVMAYDLLENTNPQAVKLTITESPFGAGQSSEGIIALEDGKLKLCYPPTGGQRPKTFDGSAGSSQHYFILKRAPR